MSFEQIDFFDNLDSADGDGNNAQKTEAENNLENSAQKSDDGLSFHCEVCQDQGCSECGWGRDYK